MSLETKEHKQRLIDCFVNAVYLYDDKLVITFHYKEASKTVTLKEVNGSIIECSGVPKRASPHGGWLFLVLVAGLERPALKYWCGKLLFSAQKHAVIARSEATWQSPC